MEIQKIGSEQDKNAEKQAFKPELEALERAVAVRDLSADESSGLRHQILSAWNNEQLRLIGEEIISLTGYGTPPVLNTTSLAHVFALSGLENAAVLTRLIEERGRQLPFQSEPAESAYHGYREALLPSDSQPEN
ncbi:MAG: hypothetical protein ACAI44_40825 [Candidatus Sericytochromatia bacterium]